jgi:hypothetical protein
MASTSVGQAGGARVGHAFYACVAAGGSAAHPYSMSPVLLKGPEAARNLADAVHFLCVLHGRHPGVIDHASSRAVDVSERSWFALATSAFGAERALLARLAVAAGPIPSTPGSADSESAVAAQRHAIEMLAQSERKGCALGAALALALDWAQVRLVLDAAAQRFGVEAPPYMLGDASAIRELAANAANGAALERAMMFGADQIAIQHRGLWDLLEARQLARAAQPA